MKIRIVRCTVLLHRLLCRHHHHHHLQFFGIFSSLFFCYSCFYFIVSCLVLFFTSEHFFRSLLNPEKKHQLPIGTKTKKICISIHIRIVKNKWQLPIQMGLYMNLFPFFSVRREKRKHRQKRDQGCAIKTVIGGRRRVHPKIIRYVKSK